MTFTLAIIGRPNVGKSTLFNRLTGKQRALVDDRPGVTRDRRAGAGQLGDLQFTVIDTAGLEDSKDEESLQARMTSQSMVAMQDADLVLMVVDGRAGITPSDEHFADLVRKSHKPTLLIVNKCEGNKGQESLGEAYQLGLGDPLPFSAAHGEGTSDLYDVLHEYINNEDDAGQVDVDIPMQIALVGRPNVGKSTLFNKILGEERTLTGPEAGITRDSIMVDAQHKGKPLKLVDTAGLRKRANIDDKIEKMATGDTIETIRYAHVVVWVVDANQPLEKQDNQIADYCSREGRALVLAVNKWDTIDDKKEYLAAIERRLITHMHQLSGLTVVPLSAKTGSGVGALLNACFRTYDVWNTKIGTSELNRWLEAMLESHPPPLVSKRRIKIRYMTQKCARPPTFMLFSNLKEVPEHYVRYLIKGVRQAFKLPGVPVRMIVKKNKNPYENKSNKKPQ